MNEAFLDYYRCPEEFARFKPSSNAEERLRSGYFQFGSGTICFGEAKGKVCDEPDGTLADITDQVQLRDATCLLPFSPTEIARNLRYERYAKTGSKSRAKTLVRKLYYAFRPALPVRVRRHLQKAYLSGWEKRRFPKWPVDSTVDQMFHGLMRFALKASEQERVPFIWFWPSGKSSCATMTHDVETAAGLNFTSELMDINSSFGIQSSFQLIPDARYVVTQDKISSIKERGFEVNVHDLKHDGHLFADHDSFRHAAARINSFGVAFGSQGFRAAVLYRNQEWFDALDFSYDMSVPNVGHLDPQRGGCCTVMPYFIGNLLEIPVTMTQDYTLFNVLNSYSLDLWRQQISLIMQHHGLISFIVHPDYLNSAAALNAYTSLLGYLSDLRANADLWIALPGQINEWWRQRSNMNLVRDGANWRIEGEGANRATIAYATLKNDKLTYEFA